MISALRMDISARVFKVFRRHLTVYRRSWKVSLSFNFFEPLLYLAALGYGLGVYVQAIEGLTYIQFIAPALIASSAMFSSAYECTYGTYIRMEFQKTFQAMVATPVSMDEVSLGEILWGSYKSFLYGSVILFVILVLGLVASPWALLVPVVLLVSGLLFAAMSMIWIGLIPNIDSFNYYFSLVITPLFLFSGVFFPLSGLPAIVQSLAWASPLFHVVNLTRGLVLGDVGVHLVWDFLWLVVVAAVLIPIAIHLMRRLVIR
ncbi:MAG: ABC transporter permease [Eubacteriales bacterium]|nr:ABC transporter permease [Bacillota bacterium]MBV1727124.1 ABC transporter permease [Desulforudis sp.]MDP3050424.1 ABC transporter permease [Eubacteriales bacterium]MBU4532305.1 ABC transporter permease [Bacillota bacterium]MBU4554174.1 ABC transporter permease [Bacillota bacterium]